MSEICNWVHYIKWFFSFNGRKSKLYTIQSSLHELFWGIISMSVEVWNPNFFTAGFFPRNVRIIAVKYLFDILAFLIKNDGGIKIAHPNSIVEKKYINIFFLVPLTNYWDLPQENPKLSKFFSCHRKTFFSHKIYFILYFILKITFWTVHNIFLFAHHDLISHNVNDFKLQNWKM